MSTWNWRNYGVPVTGAPEPGDIAVARRGVRTGDTGSHVTFVENYDQKAGTFKGLGGNQRAGMESTFNAGGYDFRRANRAQIDNGMAQRVEGTGKITVDVNAPKGTRVGAEGGGLFKKTEVQRNTQMEPAASSLGIQE
jgi:hypothetical protein